MSTEKANTTRDQQIDAMVTASKASAISLLASLIGVSLTHMPVLVFFADQLRPYATLRLFPLYLALSFTGVSLFAMSRRVDEKLHGTTEDNEDPQEQQSDASEDEIEEFVKGMRTMFVGVVGMNFAAVLVYSGAVAGLLTNAYVGPTAAILVSLAYPVLDYRVYEKVQHPVTPVMIITVASYVTAAVVVSFIIIFILLFDVLNIQIQRIHRLLDQITGIFGGENSGLGLSFPGRRRRSMR